MRKEHLDSMDLLILKKYYDQPNVSLRELMKLTFLRSLSAISFRVNRLEKNGYIKAPPEKGLARSRGLTDLGVQFLKDNRIIK